MYNLNYKGCRWGFTFLVGCSRLSEEDKTHLFFTATTMYLDGEREKLVETENLEGLITTENRVEVLGGISGQIFDVELNTNYQPWKVSLKFLVSEQTIGHGASLN